MIITRLGSYDRATWKDGFGCGIVSLIIVEIVVGILWMLLTGSYWTT